MNFDFSGKTVLITAGSKGMGFALANNFAKCNANVVICSRNNKNLKIAKKKILSENKKAKILALKFDISKTDEIDNLFKKIEKHYLTSVNILINNSGGPPVKEILKITHKDLDNAINNNFKSAVFFSKVALKKMIKSKWGRIINLTSTTAREPEPNFALSNSTRSALASFSKTLSLEVGKYGITVNTILTGGCMTDRLKSLISNHSKMNSKKYSKKIKSISLNVPVRFIAVPDEFIQQILFLASENSSYITGAAIPIDGGTSKSIF